MLRSSWQHPWKNGRDLCQTWWKYGGDKDGGWKGEGLLCGVLGLTMMFCGGRCIWIGAVSFHCGELFGGFCGAGVQRWDWKVDFGIVMAAFSCWDLGVGSLWRWGNLGYWYYHNCTSCLSPLSGLPLSIQRWYSIWSWTQQPHQGVWGREHVKWLHNSTCPS